MNELRKLIHRIKDRVNINLREPSFDVGPYIENIIPLDQFSKFYAFYALTPHHPLHFHFANSSLGGSYFLGKCVVEHSILYKSDIRGDELKSKGGFYTYHGLEVPLHDDEIIHIKDSFLSKTLVHSNSHDPENPEEFFIKNTVSLHYANIHGAPIEGSFMGPFSTLDLTTVHDCVIGAYAYVQVGEIGHQFIQPGQVWVHADRAFDFSYRYPMDVLEKYISNNPGEVPRGIFMDFVEQRKEDFQQVFDSVNSCPPINIPHGAFVSRYAVVKGNTSISENVLVAQRAYLEDAVLGEGSNAQENCYIVAATLAGYNVTAHGGKIIHAKLGRNVFVGFNSFLHGTPNAPLTIGERTIVMPHTIIDLEEGIDIPPGQLVWGYIRSAVDLEEHSISLEDLYRVDRKLQIGAMRFQGSGSKFVQAFRHRIEHILESNGAYFERDTDDKRGHAQNTQSISFNTIQPYPDGELKGLYPTIDIRP